MATKTKTTLEKLNSAEKQKQELIKKRYQEILNIIIKQNALTLDDDLIAGFFLFANKPENKDHPTLSEFKQLAKTKFPSKRKSTNKKPA